MATPGRARKGRIVSGRPPRSGFAARIGLQARVGDVLTLPMVVVVGKSMGSANSVVRRKDGVLMGDSDPRQRGTLAVGY
jgi:gamma-glutamyltranspeptidase